MNSEFRRSDVG